MIALADQVRRLCFETDVPSNPRTGHERVLGNRPTWRVPCRLPSHPYVSLEEFSYQPNSKSEVKSLPDWSPGTGFKKTAKAYKKMLDDVGELPIAHVREELVSRPWRYVIVD